VESDPVCHDWIHHNQHGRNHRPHHCPAKWLYPSRLVYRLQSHASFCRRQSGHLLDALPKLSWINQEIIYIRLDLYVDLLLTDSLKLTSSHGMGKRERHSSPALLGTMGTTIYQFPLYSLRALLVLHRYHPRYQATFDQEEQEEDRRPDSGGWNGSQYQFPCL
jgi:hypothetical protein